MNTSAELTTKFIEQELKSALTSELSEASDLLDIVDWEALHPDERLDFFLFIFCHEFQIKHPDWSEYAEKGRGIRGWFGTLIKGGPDVQHFQMMNFDTLPVKTLIEMVETRNWVHPNR